jgi:hypothetical protein
MTGRVAHGVGVLTLTASITLTTSRGLPAQAQTQHGQTAIPDTPPGRVLKAWFDAFNSGDSARMEAYYKKYEPAKSAAGQIAFRRTTGGFDLVSVEKSELLHLEYVVRDRARGISALGVIDLESDTAGTAKSSVLSAMPPGESIAAFRIDAVARARVIDGAVARLNEFYVFPEVAKRMGDTVRARLTRGDYKSITNGLVFANRLTDDFRAVSHDKHLSLIFSASRTPDSPPAQNPDLEATRRQMERINCGFVKVEQLPGNVGYLKFIGFGQPDLCSATASAAMNFLANVDALIVDLRDNGGGNPKMVAYVSSYLFSARTHLDDIWDRKSGSIEEFWTLDSIPGKRLGSEKPVYVLTSSRTFSAAEEFSYNLKMLKRATIIGETTAGGAHPVSGHRIDEHFMIVVPGARAINPISKTNWEGVGVEPDVSVAAADAMAVAQKLATEKLGLPR